MKGSSHLVQGLAAENRALRNRIAVLEKNEKESDLIERLICAALTGAISKGLSPKKAAEVAIKASDAVMERVISLGREAEKAMAEAEAEAGNEAEGSEEVPDQEPKSNLIIAP